MTVCVILCLQAVDLALPREMVEGVEQFKACPLLDSASFA